MTNSIDQIETALPNSSYCIIIPCYNEAFRLNPVTFIEYLNANENCTLIFVDDCSTDETVNKINDIKTAIGERIHLIQNKKNVGKAESVRLGMLSVENSGFNYFSYLDADLSAPLNTIPFLIKILNTEKSKTIVFGSRIKMKDTVINRNVIRHILGRIFTALVDAVLKINIYDTQCGAKVFKSDIVQQVFKKPFLTKWLFDIEIVLRTNKTDILEVPIKAWKDKKGSKLTIIDLITTPFQILKIYLNQK